MSYSHTLSYTPSQMAADGATDSFSDLVAALDSHIVMSSN